MSHRWPGPVRIFISRPRLLGGMAAGAATWVLLTLWPHGPELSTRNILSWDIGALFVIVTNLVGMREQEAADIQRRSADQDEGRGVILALVLVAAVFSLGAIGIELSAAKGAHGLEKSLRVALAFGTVAASWFLVLLIFALHYAHEYYELAHNGAEPPHLQEGLAFPGGEPPDYWDFLHFAVVIGVASQTADIAFTRKALRRIGTVQGVVAFTFNTVVLALTINLLASLFG